MAANIISNLFLQGICFHLNARRNQVPWRHRSEHSKACTPNHPPRRPSPWSHSPLPPSTVPKEAPIQAALLPASATSLLGKCCLCVGYIHAITALEAAQAWECSWHSLGCPCQYSPPWAAAPSPHPVSLSRQLPKAQPDSPWLRANDTTFTLATEMIGKADVCGTRGWSEKRANHTR